MLWWIGLLMLLLGWTLPSGAATLTTTPSQGLVAAIGRMRGGDTLVVGCGTYNEIIATGTIPSGTATQPTVLRAERPRCAILQPAFGTSRIVSFGENGANQHWITLDGLVLDGAQTGTSISALAIMGQSGTGDLLIVNNEIRNLKGTPTGMSTAFGIWYGWAPTGVVIRGNAIHHIGLGDTPSNQGWAYGIYLSSSGLTFEHNDLWNISGYAIHGYSGGGDVGQNIVRNNYFHETGAGVLLCHRGNQMYNNILYRVARGPACQGNAQMCAGILLGGYCSGTNATENLVVNNTVVDSGGACVQLSNSGGVQANQNTVRNTICWRNDQDQVVLGNGSGNTVDHNLLGQDPRFVQTLTSASPSTAFQLAQGSPAIDYGVTTPALTTDMGGNARQQGGNQDAGAWEYQGGGVTVPPEPPPSNTPPVAWWKFDEGQGQRATDASGNNHTLSWTTNPGPAWATALQCDGTNNGAHTAAGDVIPITRAYTWVVWFASRIRPTLGGSDQQIFYKGEQFGLFWSSNDACCVTAASHRLANGEYMPAARITQPLTAGEVYHLAGTWDGQTVRVYLNGELQASQAAASLHPQGEGLTVCNPSSSPVVGTIGDLRLWDRALSAEEIRAEAATPPR